MFYMKCGDCGLNGIHACLGKPVKQEDLQNGLLIIGDPLLTDKERAEMIRELDKNDRKEK